jgi:hypothetical protein
VGSDQEQICNKAQLALEIGNIVSCFREWLANARIQVLIT